ncbi:hypothetical protein DLM77_20760 [Leptospira yasudae]|uniref:Uncharacterized protein n=1 Tax=Leptospira yasudae TaxID=2202201 RepID=A0ABX9LXL7_9LEPT|nr:hypothetical protein DLM77_20760 [Leptospira yasudae]
MFFFHKFLPTYLKERSKNKKMTQKNRNRLLDDLRTECFPCDFSSENRFLLRRRIEKFPRSNLDSKSKPIPSSGNGEENQDIQRHFYIRVNLF